MGLLGGYAETDEGREAMAYRDYIVTQAEAAAGDLKAAHDLITKLKETLHSIAAGDVPRPVSTPYRADGRPCKDDMCEHDVRIRETCSECTAVFVRGVLKST
jgi:hypothetical protein